MYLASRVFLVDTSPNALWAVDNDDASVDGLFDLRQNISPLTGNVAGSVGLQHHSFHRLLQTHFHLKQLQLVEWVKLLQMNTGAHAHIPGWLKGKCAVTRHFWTEWCADWLSLVPNFWTPTASQLWTLKQICHNYSENWKFHRTDSPAMAISIDASGCILGLLKASKLLLSSFEHRLPRNSLLLK